MKCVCDIGDGGFKKMTEQLKRAAPHVDASLREGD